MSMVRYKQGELPPLTENRKAELKALADMPDSGIDYSDIPPLTEEFWKKAVPNPFYKPIKTHASVRIDSDVMAWLKSYGKGYQTRMNAILREAMMRTHPKLDVGHKAHLRRKPGFDQSAGGCCEGSQKST